MSPPPSPHTGLSALPSLFNDLSFLSGLCALFALPRLYALSGLSISSGLSAFSGLSDAPRLPGGTDPLVGPLSIFYARVCVPAV